ncbi:hypothetical protein [Sphingomonas pituitosa]|uniref:hypothetical protein n=1 Tax=Sphingomonas pituitosa TaxID=99597 RepID=UPI000829C022|nr:hypothetical protein [Sphingomonas pituitosa]
MATFRQRDPLTGALQFDSGAGDKAAIILGGLSIDYASNPDGAIDVPALNGSRPFAFVRGEAYLGRPNVTVSGSTLIWHRTPTQGGNYPTTGTFDVLYGGIDLITLGGAAGSRMVLRNDAGKIVFTSLFASYQHAGKTTATKFASGFQRANQWLISPPGALNPARMVAIRPVGAPAGPMGASYTAAGPTGIRLAAPNNWSGAGDFYLIEKPSQIAAKPGFNARSPITGELTFSSAQQAVRAVDIINGAPGSWVGTPGRKYAAVFPGMIGYHGDEETDLTMQGGQLIVGDNPPYWTWTGYALTAQARDGSPHILDFDWLQHSGNLYGVNKANPQPLTYNTGTIMIVDVTGL